MFTVDVLADYRTWLRAPSTASMDALLASMQAHALSLTDTPAGVLLGKLRGINGTTYYALTAHCAACNTVAALSAEEHHDRKRTPCRLGRGA